MERNVLDISQFISNIKANVSKQPVVSGNGANYYGRITIYFEDGKVNHIERVETIK